MDIESEKVDIESVLFEKGKDFSVKTTVHSEQFVNVQSRKLSRYCKRNIPKGNCSIHIRSISDRSIDFKQSEAYTLTIKIKQMFNCKIKKKKEIRIMKKTYKIEVDCANCANLMENAAKKVEGVADATVNFMTQKMIVEFAEGKEPKAVMKDVLKACRKVEPDCEIEI